MTAMWSMSPSRGSVASQPIADGVGVHEQGAGGGLQTPAQPQVGRHCFLEGRTHDVQRSTDQGGDLFGGQFVAGQEPFGQQIVGVDGVGRLGPPGERPQARQRRSQGAAGLADTGDDGADDGGGIEFSRHFERHLVDGLIRIGPPALQRTHARRCGRPSQDHDDGVPAHRDQAVGGDLTASVAQVRGRHGVQSRTGRDGDHGAGAAPAGGAGPASGVRGGVVKHRVHGDGFQARVPGSAGLGGVRIHLGGGEADVASECQHQNTDRIVVLRGDHLGRFVDDDVQDGAHQRQGLLERDGAGQRGGRHVEDARRHDGSVGRLHGVHEHRHAQACDGLDLASGRLG